MERWKGRGECYSALKRLVGEGGGNVDEGVKGGKSLCGRGN